jgi:hypothetical protein
MSRRFLHAGSAWTYAPPYPSEMVDFHLTPHWPPRPNNDASKSSAKPPLSWAKYNNAVDLNLLHSLVFKIDFFYISEIQNRLTK